VKADTSKPETAKPEPAPMNVLFQVGSLEPRSTTSHTLYLARQIQDLGHGVRIVTPGGPLEPEFARWKLELVVEPRLGMTLRARSGAARVARALDRTRFKPDLMHALSPDVDAVGALVAETCRLPFFLSVHTALRRHHALHLPRPLLRGIIAGSQEIRENLVNQRRLPRNLLRVISTGVDAKYFRPDGRLRDPRHSFIPVVGMVGRFELHKGAADFIRAAKIVVEQGHDVHFLLSGEGPEAEHLREMVLEMRLESRITFAPASRDYRSLLGAIDVFVRPGTREGLGISLLEAMASGKPVIASGVGSIFSIVKDGETGYVVPKADVAKLALAVTRLVTNPARAMEMGRRARKLVEKDFEIADKSRQTVAFYREKLDG